MKTLVEVTQTVEVEVDESKFNDEFMREYRRQFYPWMSIKDHVKHIAQMEARGLLPFAEDGFVEGYGPMTEMGIKARVIDQHEETNGV